MFYSEITLNLYFSTDPISTRCCKSSGHLSVSFRRTKLRTKSQSWPFYLITFLISSFIWICPKIQYCALKRHLKSSYNRTSIFTPICFIFTFYLLIFNLFLYNFNRPNCKGPKSLYSTGYLYIVRILEFKICRDIVLYSIL